MPNLYGVSNSAGITQLFNTIGATAVVCPASVPTAIMTSAPFVAPSAGFFIVTAFAALSVTFGASIPGNLSVGVGIGAGSAQNFVGMNAPYPASGTLQVYFSTFSVNAELPWRAPGSTITLYMNPFSQGVTVNFAGSWASAMLVRGPDQ